MSTARDRKRRIHALLSRWETIRFANSEKECVEDFAAMIVDLEDRLAQYRVIPALPATPAPLDVALCDCGHGYPSYGIGKAKHLPSCHYGIIADWLDATPAPLDVDAPDNANAAAASANATPAPLDGHQTPGEFHDYRVACVKCGEPGFLHVSWRPEKYEETP